MARILFVTDQWGYGTTTSAISIAAALRGSDTTVLVGHGPGFNLARRGSFEECIQADAMADRPPEILKEAVRESDVVVSVMNRTAAEVADLFNVPCLYVDSLLWMWDQPPRLPSSIVRYFAEGFSGVERSIERWRGQLPHPAVVSPLISSSIAGDLRERSGALVNFGGLSTWLMPQKALVTYARSMIECAVEALAEWPGRVTVSVGQHVLNAVDPAGLRLARGDVSFVDLNHPAYLGELERSRVVVSSPGLHATEEALSRGIPCLLLPSQNLSQVLALEKLDAGRAAFALDWRAIYGLNGLSAADERRSCRRIGDCIELFQEDPSARTRLVAHLRSRLSSEQLRRISGAQSRFFERYRDGSGPQDVASYIRHLVSPR